jgi:hypothetical protein
MADVNSTATALMPTPGEGANYFGPNSNNNFMTMGPVPAPALAPGAHGEPLKDGTIAPTIKGSQGRTGQVGIDRGSYFQLK